MTRPPFVFIATEGFPATVYDSQVADHLRVLDRHGLSMDVVNFDPLYPQTMSTERGRQRVARFRAALPGRLTVRPYVPYEDRLGAPLAFRQLRRLLRAPGPWVVHARGLQAAFLACRLAAVRSDVRVIYDVRGDYWAEHRFHHTGRGDGWAPGLARLQRAEGLVCAAASRLFVVSNALRDTLAARHPCVAEKVHVFPCSFDPGKFRRDPQARESWRQRLGVTDRLVIVYAGSLISYQLPEVVASLGALALNRWEEAHLLLLTPHLERAQDLVRAAGIASDRVTVKKAAHGEMPGLLSASDVALLLRRRDPVNAVASPTKLAEYLACGLPVLLSRGIGDSATLVEQYGLGTVVDSVEDVDSLGGHLEQLISGYPDPEYVSGVAREQLSRDRFVPEYLRVYRELAGT